MMYFNFRNTTVYGWRETDAWTTSNFSFGIFSFEGYINTSRLLFAGDYFSLNSLEHVFYDPSPYYHKYIGNDEYYLELTDFFAFIKFTLNTPLIGNISITNYAVGYNPTHGFRWNFKNATKVHGDSRRELDDAYWELNSHAAKHVFSTMISSIMPFLDCIINKTVGVRYSKLRGIHIY